jgi:hypothetical protein
MHLRYDMKRSSDRSDIFIERYRDKKPNPVGVTYIDFQSLRNISYELMTQKVNCFITVDPKGSWGRRHVVKSRTGQRRKVTSIQIAALSGFFVPWSGSIS